MKSFPLLISSPLALSLKKFSVNIPTWSIHLNFPHAYSGWNIANRADLLYLLHQFSTTHLLYPLADVRWSITDNLTEIPPDNKNA